VVIFVLFELLHQFLNARVPVYLFHISDALNLMTLIVYLCTSWVAVAFITTKRVFAIKTIYNKCMYTSDALRVVFLE
jgi:hypothetical protein